MPNRRERRALLKAVKSRRTQPAQPRGIGSRANAGALWHALTFEEQQEYTRVQVEEQLGFGYEALNRIDELTRLAEERVALRREQDKARFAHMVNELEPDGEAPR